MTLKELAEKLTEIVKDNPDIAKLPVQASAENGAGEDLYPILGEVHLAKVGSVETYYKVLIGVYHEYGCGITKDECNVVILD